MHLLTDFLRVSDGAECDLLIINIPILVLVFKA